MFKHYKIGFPGGCKFEAERPIDIHIDILKHFGVVVTLNSNFY